MYEYIQYITKYKNKNAKKEMDTNKIKKTKTIRLT